MKAIKAEEQPIRIRIRSVQYHYAKPLSDRFTGDPEPNHPFGAFCEDPLEEEIFTAALCEEANDPFLMVADGILRKKGNLYEIVYHEDLGEGDLPSRVSIVFSALHENTVTLTKTGLVKMTLSFEQGKHHVGSYFHPLLLSAFGERIPLLSYTSQIQNDLLRGGELHIDYLIEIRGLDTMRIEYTLSLSEIQRAPHPRTE